MSDLPQPPAPPGPTGGGSFCPECGAHVAPGTEFCGNCGAAQAAAEGAPGGGAPTPGGAAAPGGAGSAWAGVAPIVEDPRDAPPVPPAPPGPGPMPPGPGAGGPTPPGPPPKKGGKGPLIAIAALVVAALAVGGFLLVGGDDDENAGDDTTTTTEDEDETTTTEDPEETTTTSEAEGTTTTAVDDDPLAGIEFATLTDDSGRLIVQAPAEWSDVSTAPLNAENRPTIQASTDLQAFRTGFEVPGMSFSLLATPPEDFDQALDFLAGSVNLPNQCVSAGKDDYSDGVFTGRLEVWQNCADIGTTLVLVVGARDDGLTVEINVQLPRGEPVEIADQIANTFNIVD